MLINRRKQLNRQSYEKSFYINGSIFIALLRIFLKEKKFLNRNSTFFRMNKSHSIDVNDIFDKRLIQTFLFNNLMNNKLKINLNIFHGERSLKNLKNILKKNIIIKNQ